MNNEKANQRIYYLDILRVIACLSVIITHSSSKYLLDNLGSFNFCIGNIFDSLSRIGVPLFIMISGTLMLDKNYNYSKKKLINHIIRMIAFFIFWSILYCILFQILVPLIITHETIDISKIISSFIQGHYHLWFVYMIVGLYLILPLLRLWIKDENKKYIEYFIILSIIFTFIIPQVATIGSVYSSLFKNINTIIGNLNLKYVGGFTTYFILGWYIHNYDIKNKKLIYILGIVSFIVTIIGTYILSVSTGKAIQIYDNLSLNIFFQSVMVFLLIKTKFNNMEKNNKFISSVSKNSLGIYAIHIAIVSIVNYILSKFGFDNALINIPIVFIISFIISYLGTFVLSKIPIIKRTV